MQPSVFIAEHEVDQNPLPIWLRWNRSSPQLLIESEGKLFNRVKSQLRHCFVPIFDNSCFIRTVIARNYSHDESKDANTPLVLMHGFASGVALWCKNIDSLASKRPVYAFDLLGFARSSRPTFPTDPAEAESQFVSSFEEWRHALNLEKFILVAHSFGGYISTAYSILHPNRIAHLILVDPWGFLEAPFDEETWLKNSRRPWLLRVALNLVRSTSPLAPLRAAGPLARRIFYRARDDLRSFYDQRDVVLGSYYEVPKAEDELNVSHDSPVFSSATSAESEPYRVPSGAGKSTSGDTDGGDLQKHFNAEDFDGSIALDYVYHMNVQKPSIVFIANLLLFRVNLPSNPDVALTVGSCYVRWLIIEGAGHQVYAQAADDFNAYVNDIADHTDSGDQFLPSGCNHSSGPMEVALEINRPPRKVYPSSMKPSRLQTFFFHTDPGEPNSSQSSQPSGTSSHDETSDEASLWS
ncbi:hypothetical protein P879_07439 [Paragonimus westermani]|uniref:AB hydrolase-1 domain-containing protein n=1 Tax=Paragonimus westermani TaxID=34504 RepID=A0A8T0D4J1_9TREM|nr:hypothetical protein P879_07439 [Paragonimus westermani]